MYLSFRRAIGRSILKISELESERMRVTSLEGTTFSPDCEVETETIDGSGTLELCLIYRL